MKNGTRRPAPLVFIAAGDLAIAAFVVCKLLLQVRATLPGTMIAGSGARYALRHWLWLGAEIVLVILLSAAGTGLLRLRPWSRYLQLAICVMSPYNFALLPFHAVATAYLFMPGVSVLLAEKGHSSRADQLLRDDPAMSVTDGSRPEPASNPPWRGLPPMLAAIAAIDLLVGAYHLLLTIVIVSVDPSRLWDPARVRPLADLAGLFAVGPVACAAGVGLAWMRRWARTAHISFACLAMIHFQMLAFVALSLAFLLQPGVGVVLSGTPPRRWTAQQAAAARAGRGWGGPVGLALALLGAPLALGELVEKVPDAHLREWLGTAQRRRQKQALAELRELGTAIESYQVDRGYPPRVPGGADASIALAPVLIPTYLQRIPAADPWQRPYAWERAGGDDFSVLSLGRNGRREPAVLGATTAFDADIVFSNGQFTVYPEATNR